MSRVYGKKENVADFIKAKTRCEQSVVDTWTDIIRQIARVFEKSTEPMRVKDIIAESELLSQYSHQKIVSMITDMLTARLVNRVVLGEDYLAVGTNRYIKIEVAGYTMAI